MSYDTDKIIADIIKGRGITDPKTMTEFMERFIKNGEVTTWTRYEVDRQTGEPMISTEIVDISDIT